MDAILMSTEFWMIQGGVFNILSIARRSLFVMIFCLRAGTGSWRAERHVSCRARVRVNTCAARSPRCGWTPPPWSTWRAPCRAPTWWRAPCAWAGPGPACPTAVSTPCPSLWGNVMDSGHIISNQPRPVMWHTAWILAANMVKLVSMIANHGARFPCIVGLNWDENLVRIVRIEEANECNSTKQACPSDFVTLVMNKYSLVPMSLFTLWFYLLLNQRCLAGSNHG